jgi:predicted nuclease of predicted toxin-antitoxin system
VLILVDECLPMQFVTELRNRGHDVVWARETYPAYPDEEILAIAKAQGRIVLTEDRDFGRLTVQYKLPAAGIIMTKLGELSGTIPEIATFVANAIDGLGDECAGMLTVIGLVRNRQRPLQVT